MKKILFALGSAFLPALAFAQAPNFNYVGSGVDQIYRIAQTYVIPALMLAAFAFFVWGVIGYIRAKEAKDKEAKRHTLIQGVIALAVIVSVWGIVGLLQNVFGVRPSGMGPTQVCPPGYRAVGASCIP